MHSVWAVARNTLAQAVRMRIAVVVFLLLVILLPLMSMVMDGDGTLVGKLQTFSSYGLGLISFLLSILTIAISTFTLSNDIKRKSIFLVLTKPIRRFELILGKLLGIILINAALLGLFGLVVYGCTMMIFRTSDASPRQIQRAEFEFFTSRIGIKPDLDLKSLHQKAQDRYLELEKTRQLPEGMSASRVMSQLRGQELMKAKSVAPGQVKQWDFEKVRVKQSEGQDAAIFVRYKFDVTVTPPNDQVFGMWRVGDLRQMEAGADRFVTPVYRMEMEEAVKTRYEFAVPVTAIAEDGFLSVAFFNNPALNRTTIIPEDLEILYQTGSFTENFFRAVLMISIHLLFLSILGIALSTWLSFPVAILVCMVVFFAGLTNAFIMDSIDGLGAGLGMVYSFTIKPLLWMLPQFDGQYNPNGYIVDGRTLPWAFLAEVTGITICVKGLLILLAGMLIFSRREVAKAVV